MVISDCERKFLINEMKGRTSGCEVVSCHGSGKRLCGVAEVVPSQHGACSLPLAVCYMSTVVSLMEIQLWLLLPPRH